MLNPQRYNKTDYRGLLGAFLASWVFHCILVAILATTAIYYPPIANSERFDFNFIWADLGPADDIPAEPQGGDVALPAPAPPPGELSEKVATPVEETGEESELPPPAATPEEAVDAVAVVTPPPAKIKPEPVQSRDVPRVTKKLPRKVGKSKSRPPEQPPEPGLPVPATASGETKPAVTPPESEPSRGETAKPVPVVQSDIGSQRAENEQRVRLEAERQAALQAEENLRAAESVKRAEMERQAREAAAREQRVAEQMAREKAAREKAAAEQLAQEKAVRERLAAEQVAREKAAREKAAAERQAREKAARERLAAEKLAREKAAREKAAAEQLAQENAAREKAAREKAAREKLVAEQLARQKAAEEQSRRERAARLKVERELREKERLAQAHAAAEKAAKLKADLVRPVQPSKEPARQVAGNATGASSVPARVSSSVPAKADTAPAPPLNAPVEPKQPVKQEKGAGIALPPIKGDIKLAVHSEDDLSIKILFIEYPKGKHGKPMSRGEAKALQKLTPIIVRSSKNTLEAVLERAREGVYVFLVEQKGSAPADGKFSLKLFDAHVKQLAGRKVSGETEVARLMMPEGVLWEDDSSFTGNMEDSDSITKFNSDTGLVWKVYRK